MTEAILIFPHQLFSNHPGLSKRREVYVVEDSLFFYDPQYRHRFHKKKLVLHRASMRAFGDKLTSKGYRVHYMPYQPESSMEYLFEKLARRKIKRIYCADVIDSRLEKRIIKKTRKHHKDCVWLPTPNFLISNQWFKEFFSERRRYSQTQFYIAQRKRLKILVDEGKPVQGKWSFDPLNRKKIPKGLSIPAIRLRKSNRYVSEAQDYVEKHFSSHPGTVEEFLYPVTHEEAIRCFKDFLDQRFQQFGDYQDAIAQDEPFLFHSLLSPVLNIGLLTPEEVVDQTLNHARKRSVPMNSLEGFIRQVIGWREFMGAIYKLKGEEQRTSNFWQHRRGIPDSFYRGATGIAPLDTVIRRLLKYSYAHHIERLMVLGNFMLLCEFHPDEVYRWFMEMFIDSYDWVMVPNVYGMSQYADKGLITTKPYISSSSYLKKMSDFSGGPWCDVWDSLYWRFIHRHSTFFIKNARMKVMIYQLNKMGKKKRDDHLKRAKAFLDKL